MSGLLTSINITNWEIPSLEEFCLEVIIRDFSLFTTTFDLTKDESLKMDFRFLQRFYSKRLFKRLIEEEKLEECHLNFFLNEYLQDIPIIELLRCTSKDYLLEKLIPIGQSINQLCCLEINLWSDIEVKVEKRVFVLNELVPHAAQVREIHISNICNDNLLHLIATSCAQLTVLDISGSYVSEEGLKALYTSSDGSTHANCRLKQIHLDCMFAIVDDDVSALLKNVPSLEEVTYERLAYVLYNISQEVIDGSNNNSNVEKINLNLTNLEFSSYSRDQTSLIEACAEVCPYVRDLYFEVRNPKEIESCCHFSNLERVSLQTCNRSTFNLNIFLKTKGQHLKHFSTVGFVLSTSFLIENCPKLETLNLWLDNFDALNTKIVKKLLHLKSLTLNNVNFADNHCSDSVLLLLNSSPNLESLTFFQNDFVESKNLTKFTIYSLSCKLKELQITGSRLCFSLVKQFLLNCNSLQSLCIHCCPFLNSEEISLLKQIAISLNKKVEL